MLQRGAPVCGTGLRVDTVLLSFPSYCLSGQFHAEEDLVGEGFGVQVQAVTPDPNCEWQQQMMT